MAAQEHQPLLPPHRNVVQTPLPKLKLAVVFAVKLLIPVASAQPSPYINKMIENILGGPEKVGYYAGFVTSSFHLAQMLGMYPWARLSDRIGRKPVLLIGALGSAVCAIVFGFVNSIWAMVVIRFILGFFCGTTGAIHAVVGDLTDESNQSTAFPLYDIVAAVGLIVGPLIGGTFANPIAEHATWSYAGLRRLFEAYPYLLPNLVTSVLALSTSLLAFFVLDETLPPGHSTPSSSESSPQRDSEDFKHNKTFSVSQLLALPDVRSICVSTFLLGFLAAGFNVSVVLVSYSRVIDGGLALSPQQIGFALSLMGGLSIFLKLSLTCILRPTPGARHSVSHKLTSLFTKTMATWPITFAGFIVLGLVSAAQGENASKGLIWAVLSVVLFLSRIGCIPFTLIMMLVKEHTPTPASLGTLNGLTELVQAISIVMSPTLIGSLFAFSKTHDVLGGYLWVVFYVFCAIGGAFIASRLETQQPEHVADPGEDA
ncbi:MFS general substrate transporter [Cristinia sonorae]|uniref:MFS general substrate transporter n=1 Tax=Cristinia sonorae TaxID=1940300 RepID=A0A8K0UT77_9AGAR|nr:MFS general substrate transporter [Cristinia sonorae]